MIMPHNLISKLAESALYIAFFSVLFTGCAYALLWTIAERL